MPLVAAVTVFFALAAFLLLCLGRNARCGARHPERTVRAGMNEHDVLHAIGPPSEVIRLGDPLDPAFFSEKRAALYIYEGLGEVRFENGVVEEFTAATTPRSRSRVLAREKAAAAPTAGTIGPPRQVEPERAAEEAIPVVQWWIVGGPQRPLGRPDPPPPSTPPSTPLSTPPARLEDPPGPPTPDALERVPVVTD